MDKEKIMKEMLRALLATSVLLCPAVSYAHSGRTDANGGHYNRTTGTYEL